MSQPDTLSISQLLSQDHYIIPIYQRNYAWGEVEIEALLTDIKNAMDRTPDNNYYVGSLIVFKRDDGKFEVIDGQQRLTTLTLIVKVLKNSQLKEKLPEANNISFEYRKESDRVLENLSSGKNSSGSLPSNFKDAIDAIEKYLDDNNPDKFVNFLLSKVEVIRTEVPPKTDLNHYFEIMNTRGEQLEKHEVLKARLMSKLSKINGDQGAFSKIWDACSDMSRYMIMSFDTAFRKQFFGEDWQSLPDKFDSISQYFIKPNNEASVQNSRDEVGNRDNLQPTIINIIESHFKGQEENKNETSERFNPVIDFSNFLMHVLKIYVEQYPYKQISAKKIPLDERNLLESFKFLDKDDHQTEIKNFALLLLQIRFLFDRYVIKTDTSKEKDDHWSLLTLKPADKSSYQYNNTFSDAILNQNVIMLLSMFHVSNPSRMYKNWLYAVVRWLVNQKIKDKDIEAKSYIDYLENLSDRYYFGHYGNGLDFFELITADTRDINATTAIDKYLNSGTNVPNFIFNRLDYLLWKSKEYRNIYPNFRFTFRSSVEHFYPQNPSEENQDETIKDVLHSFGNLCLISSSTNSKFTNNMPKAKKANFGNSQYNSIKLAIMMEKADEWDKTQIEKHGHEMIDILNKRLLNQPQ